VVRGAAEPVAICAWIIFTEGGLPTKLSASLDYTVNDRTTVND
jgi:hypothetical protein